MNICVLMFYDDKIKEYSDINFQINKLYCEKYNLNLLVSHKKIYKDRHSAWERLPLILEHIKNYEYVIWIDADAFFYIDSDNIKDIIEANPDKNFIFSNDRRNDHVNSGFFIVKNCEYCINFLNKWAYDKELYKNNPHKEWWDQGVLIDMINKNIFDIKNNSKFYDFGILQHFTDEDLKIFSKKPFIRHSAGKSTKYRVKVSNDYLKLIK